MPACIICYNEFGVSNPEGLTETPIRLPKCKHVFGDKCIKKWFEDSDSCPYCRDKLPSELSVRKSLAYETYRAARREHMLAHQRARQGFAPRYPFSEESGASRYVFSCYEPSHLIGIFEDIESHLEIKLFMISPTIRELLVIIVKRYFWSSVENHVFCCSVPKYVLMVLTL